MVNEGQYLLITSEITPEVQEYLKRKHLDFSVFPLPTLKNLSQVPNRNFGWYAWKDCDNFIKGVEKDSMGGGWNKYLCRAYKDKPKGLNHSIIPDSEVSKYHKQGLKIDNKGEADHSWICCSYCVHYSPRTIEGRKKVAELFVKEYERLFEKAVKEVERLGNLSKEISPLLYNPE